MCSYLSCDAPFVPEMACCLGCYVSSYDEASRFASADAIKAERSKAPDAPDYRVIEEYLRYKKFTLMVSNCCALQPALSL